MLKKESLDADMPVFKSCVCVWGGGCLMCRCEYVGIYSHMCQSMRMPEQSIRWPPPLLPTLFLETGTLTKLECHTQLADQQAFRSNQSPSPNPGVTDIHSHTQIFTWVLEI